MAIVPTDRTVCLQINLHPLDAPHAVHTLPHQVATFSTQVDEIQLTLDLLRSEGSRYRTADYPAKLAALRQLIAQVARAQPKVVVAEVDYSEATTKAISKTFLGGAPVPRNAENGSPFHAYLFGFLAAKSAHVLHLDSDMMFGGGSTTWVSEAVDHLAADRKLFACCPLPGPPMPSGVPHPRRRWVAPVPYEGFFSDAVNTRALLFDKRRFERGELQLQLVRAPWAKRVQSFINYTAPYVALEDTMTAMMKRRHLLRLDFLGRGNGLWSLHPVYRSPRFYEALPELIERVRSGDVPDAQRGDYNLNDSMFDWSEVRASLTPQRKLKRRLEFARAGITARWRDLRA